jgi:hypothetical protein
MTTFTMQRRDRSSATVLADGVVVGHLGLFAGCCYVNGAHRYGFAHVAHVSTLDLGLADFIHHATRGAQP